MTQSITLRETRLSDEPFLRVVYSSTRIGELALVNWTEDQKAAFLRMQFDAQRSHYESHYPEASFLIVEREGEPIGRLYLARLPAEIRILDIALLPQHRGQGVGSRLLEEILAEAQVTRKPVRIHVERSNPALRLYQRLGFVACEEGPIYLSMQKVP